MIYKANSLLIFTLYFALASIAYGQDWLWKIKPLETNISQVKEMFEVTPKMVGKDELNFKIEEGTLIFRMFFESFG